VTPLTSTGVYVVLLPAGRLFVWLGRPARPDRVQVGVWSRPEVRPAGLADGAQEWQDLDPAGPGRPLAEGAVAGHVKPLLDWLLSCDEAGPLVMRPALAAALSPCPEPERR
jgi:hypothetical protein